MAGLKRRKLALEMLGAAVQTGLNRRKAMASRSEKGKKRQRDDGEVSEENIDNSGEASSPKKARVEKSEE